MSTATLEFDSVTAPEDAIEYRAIHIGSILGLVLGIVTATFTLLAWGNTPELIYVAFLNVIALSFCMWSLAKIRREPDQYTGRPVALAGLALSIVFLFGGVGYGAYLYATEVPEGYTRISFNEMKPDELEERSGVIVPADIAALDGKRVFIKGYIRPDSIPQRLGIKEFLLVRDNNQCCFGDISSINYYDQMAVDMAGSLRVDYSQGIFRMGGILKVEPQNAARGPLAPVFSLKADHAE